MHLSGFLVSAQMNLQPALFQYILPLGLLITACIVVFPRVALIVRKKGELPVIEDAVINILKARIGLLHSS